MFKKNSITQGNSLELLKKIPDKSIDLIFADPPYNLQLRETLYRPDQTTVEAVTNDWDKFDTYQAYDDFSLKWLQECKRVLKDGGAQGVIGGAAIGKFIRFKICKTPFQLLHPFFQIYHLQKSQPEHVSHHQLCDW